jgi:hypothetical protein
LPDGDWATDGAGSLYFYEHLDGDHDYEAIASVSQSALFPTGSDYIIRFDLDVTAASWGGVTGANDGGFAISIGNLFEVFRLDATTNITGPRLGLETLPFGPNTGIALATLVHNGSGPGYTRGNFDNLRVRRHVSPEPTAQIGLETACP